MLNNFDFLKPNQIINFQESSLAFTLFQVIAFTYGCVAGFYWQLLQLFSIIILWLPSAAFADNLKTNNELSYTAFKRDDIFKISSNIIGRKDIKLAWDDWRWRSIKEQYLALKELSQLLNEVVSGMIFLYTTFSLSTYSYLLDSVFLTKMETDRIRLIARYINVIITYLMAADICRKVGTLQEWITQDTLRGEGQTCSQFHTTNVLLHELNNNFGIGIRGFNAFTITYTFVANVSQTA
ncbi:unnamed protein product [Orchesella dallaii]|uniref:Uncharacterized protein n=1 Tax=Orchesella dallaii TaxID=48710 RepID=A0ABP1Q416_9HEXA